MGEASVREARRRYFESNGFGENGGYDEPWVDFKLGSVPFPFPNTAARVRAVKVHDIHHILSGYQTDLLGEFEISAWEIGAGCKDFGAAWVLNLSGMGGGLFLGPKRVLRAFVRGRDSTSLYGREVESLLDESVEELRSRHLPKNERKAKVSDLLLFALCVLLGLAVGLSMLTLMLPLIPLGLWWRGKARGAREGV